MVHARAEFAVTLSGRDGVVLLTIRDGSSPVPVRSMPQVMDMSGRGLMLVELLSEEWGAGTDRDGSKSVWASFATSPSPSAPVVA